MRREAVDFITALRALRYGGQSAPARVAFGQPRPRVVGCRRNKAGTGRCLRGQAVAINDPSQTTGPLGPSARVEPPIGSTEMASFA